MENIITNKNEYGEPIHVKIENGLIKIHHTDCTDDFITLNELIINYSINVDEFKIIYDSVKLLVHHDVDDKLRRFLLIS